MFDTTTDPAALVGRLTLAEKASLTSGEDFWTTTPLPRVGLPAIMMSDGPHGLRKQDEASDHLGLAGSVPATCFPPAVALSAAFDPDVAARAAAAIGIEAAIEDVAIVLGPGVNIKRSPLCGRNFEYFSEDPYLSGVLGNAYVQAMQAQGVGTSLKHFAANNQETDRMRISADIDPRPLREIYLRAFHRVITSAQPWTVMCSYNRINGVYTSEDPWLLTTLLRDEWGFGGAVVSDWGAVNERVVGLPAGLDLEMPSSSGRTDAELVRAVEAGTLSEDAVTLAATRVVELVGKAQRRPAVPGPLDVDAHHALARELAGRSLVLLKNDDGLLPLSPDADLAVIGAFAEQPRYQGAGSSLINPTRVDNALDEIRALARGQVDYAPGFSLDGSSDPQALIDEAVALAARAPVAVVFLGLPAVEESEGFDRENIDLPAEQLDLLGAVVAVNPRTVVVLSNGGVVALPFRDDVPAILEGWLLGQAGGGATADVLFGTVNPSGRLAETIPLRLEDNPSYDNFPGSLGHVRYGEGVFVGYRWYDHRDVAVAYPFGHGLSYTSFHYGDATAHPNPDGGIDVHVALTNTGECAGREVVQVYTSLADSVVERPPRELKAFSSVLLEPGQTRTVSLTIDAEELAYWDIRVDAWILEPGIYTVAVGSSSRDLHAHLDVELVGEQVRLPLTLNSSLAEVFADPVIGPDVRAAFAAFSGASDAAGASMMSDDASLQKILASFPIGRFSGFPGVPVHRDKIEELLRGHRGTA